MSTDLTPPDTVDQPPSADPKAVRDVWRLLVSVNNDSDLLDHIKSTYPESEGKAIITAAVHSIRQSGNASGSVIKGWCFEAYKDLYARSRANEDYATAKNCVDKIAALFKGATD